MLIHENIVPTLLDNILLPASSGVLYQITKEIYISPSLGLE